MLGYLPQNIAVELKELIIHSATSFSESQLVVAVHETLGKLLSSFELCKKFASSLVRIICLSRSY